jgi:hypothetical protein
MATSIGCESGLALRVDLSSSIASDDSRIRLAIGPHMTVYMSEDEARKLMGELQAALESHS